MFIDFEIREIPISDSSDEVKHAYPHTAQSFEFRGMTPFFF